jgi:hypothetical protein
MNEILEKITSIIQAYESGQYKDLYEGHRKLTCNMFFLAKEQVEAHQRHNAAYYNSVEKTNAGKEREADKLVPELYMCRKVLETAKGVAIAMGHELKMN